MKQVRCIMGMPVILEMDGHASQKLYDTIFSYFEKIDATFSTYRDTSEITKMNRGYASANKNVQEILKLAAQTKFQTQGFFDIAYGGTIDPSGLVKGWAIHNAARMLQKLGIRGYYLEVGGDIEIGPERPRVIGIRNPFHKTQIVKRVVLQGKGIATSGTYERGSHIMNPLSGKPTTDIRSITVIGPNVYEADRFATAAFAMGKHGITFIAGLPGFEGLSIDNAGIATSTPGFASYEIH